MRTLASRHPAAAVAVAAVLALVLYVNRHVIATVLFWGAVNVVCVVALILAYVHFAHGDRARRKAQRKILDVARHGISRVGRAL